MEKKYVYVVTSGINGVDERRELGRFNDMTSAAMFESMYLGVLIREARNESQQVHYRNDKEFTQFDIQIEKALYDEDGYFEESDVSVYETTPKFRYGQIVK